MMPLMWLAKSCGRVESLSSSRGPQASLSHTSKESTMTRWRSWRSFPPVRKKGLWSAPQQAPAKASRGVVLFVKYTLTIRMFSRSTQAHVMDLPTPRWKEVGLFLYLSQRSVSVIFSYTARRKELDSLQARGWSWLLIIVTREPTNYWPKHCHLVLCGLIQPLKSSYV